MNVLSMFLVPLVGLIVGVWACVFVLARIADILEARK